MSPATYSQVIFLPKIRSQGIFLPATHSQVIFLPATYLQVIFHSPRASVFGVTCKSPENCTDYKSTSMMKLSSNKISML